MLALVETMTGVGCAIGPFVGGSLYDGCRSFDSVTQFAVPFLCMGGLTFLLVVFAFVFAQLPAADMGQDDDDDDGEVQVTAEFVLYQIASFLAAIAWTALEPTLENKLAPLGFSPTSVGLFFLAEGAVYTVSAFPVGHATDRDIGRAIYLTFAGVLCFAVGFAFMGPLKLGAIDLAGAFENAYGVAAGLIFVSFGNALIVIPSLPVLLVGKSESQQAKITGISLAIYSAGSVVGPVLATTLGSVMKTSFLCHYFDDSSAFCFDGMATVFAFIFTMFGVVFGVWMSANARHAARRARLRSLSHSRSRLELD
jgi:hypothetical protein